MPVDDRFPADDRLPWLETVEPYEPDALPLGRILVAVIAGLVVLAGIVFVIYRLQERNADAGDGRLIAADPGPYKVKPEEPGGMKVEGEGDAAIAISQGKGSGRGAIDLNAVPEAPVAGKRVLPSASPTPAGGRNAVAQVPGRGGKLVAAQPAASAAPRVAAASVGGALVQLGAYPSEAAANTAWTRFSKRFGYIAELGKSVQSVTIDGRTLYRLRVNAGSATQASDICGRLRVAGESCFVAG